MVAVGEFFVIVIKSSAEVMGAETCVFSEPIQLVSYHEYNFLIYIYDILFHQSIV